MGKNTTLCSWEGDPGKRGLGHHRVNICFEFLELLTSCRMLMAPGRGCFGLAILLAVVDIQLGGCMQILSSYSQEGKQLSFICTLLHKKEEAEGVTVFLCKDKSGDCSPENSLEQLRLKRDSGTDGVSETSSQLVFTIDQATPPDSGTYQCCASSQKPDVRLQGRFFSVLVTGELLMSLIPPGGT
ncbi:PREDICTED: CD160 antigen [Hipposideros armiger]|uniref:CD160 antigen n=1 Tax=Hipposideros armiger TaxID=186990 RepID=A0A8B7Q606_HIPAR|nr:PREDICTED: CD160 antigen [Hipposideros armiger]